MPRPGWPAPPEPLPLPVVDNHTHLETVLVETDDAGWRGSAGDDAWHPDDDLPSAPDDDGGSPADRARVDAILAAAAQSGVTRMVQVGCDLNAIGWTATAVREFPALLGAVAIHPNEAVLHAGVRELAPDGLAPDPQPRHGVGLDEAIARVEAAARGNDRIRAIGETGLDYFRAGERGREVQREAFRAHIALAKDLGLPLQIHDRDAHDDVVATLLADGAPERTVFHCFSGDATLAELCASRGWYLSFAGPVTYPRNEELRAAARVAGTRRLLVETDAPYLAPVPARGAPNAPYLLGHTVRVLAGELGLDLAEVCRAVDRNAVEVYGPW